MTNICKSVYLSIIQSLKVFYGVSCTDTMKLFGVITVQFVNSVGEKPPH